MNYHEIDRCAFCEGRNGHYRDCYFYLPESPTNDIYSYPFSETYETAPSVSSRLEDAMDQLHQSLNAWKMDLEEMIPSPPSNLDQIEDLLAQQRETLSQMIEEREERQRRNESERRHEELEELCRQSEASLQAFLAFKTSDSLADQVPETIMDEAVPPPVQYHVDPPYYYCPVDNSEEVVTSLVEEFHGELPQDEIIPFCEATDQRTLVTQVWGEEKKGDLGRDDDELDDSVVENLVEKDCEEISPHQGGGEEEREVEVSPLHFEDCRPMDPWDRARRYLNQCVVKLSTICEDDPFLHYTPRIQFRSFERKDRWAEMPTSIGTVMHIAVRFFPSDGKRKKLNKNSGKRIKEKPPD